MDRATRIERVLADMKGAIAHWQEAIAQAPEQDLIPFMAARKAHSGVEILGTLDKVFEDYWTDYATMKVEEEEVFEDSENADRRREAIRIGA
jgi:hypothetical protein